MKKIEITPLSKSESGQLTEDDKEGQIKRRFNEMFAEHI